MLPKPGVSIESHEIGAPSLGAVTGERPDLASLARDGVAVAPDCRAVQYNDGHLSNPGPERAAPLSAPSAPSDVAPDRGRTGALNDARKERRAA